ncbi:MAG: DUF3494 domain-containing protein [Burkholderiales bacterium]|nr:DUF3494 domain-containing protein [Burkholderiales bacterium]
MHPQNTHTRLPRRAAPAVALTLVGFARSHGGLLAACAFAALAVAAHAGSAKAASAPGLGTTSTFGVVSSTFTNANTGSQTIVNGDVCFTTGPTTPPMTITGTTTTPCSPATGNDQGLALAALNSEPCISLGAGAITLNSVVVGGNLPGVINPGCYSSGGAMNLTASTTLTLNGPGVYIFRPGGALNTGDNSMVILTNGACASDVYWTPIGAATLGANAAPSVAPTFSGNILADAGITIGHFATLTGRALAFGGTVTTDANTISVPNCAPFVVVNGNGPTGVPALAGWAMAMLAALLAAAGLVATRRRRQRL